MSPRTYSLAEQGQAQLPMPARQLARSLIDASERTGYQKALAQEEELGPWTWAFLRRDGDRLGALIALTAAAWACNPPPTARKGKTA